MTAPADTAQRFEALREAYDRHLQYCTPATAEALIIAALALGWTEADGFVSAWSAWRLSELELPGENDPITLLKLAYQIYRQTPHGSTYDMLMRCARRAGLPPIRRKMPWIINTLAAYDAQRAATLAPGQDGEAAR